MTLRLRVPTARLLLGVVVLATSAFAIRHYDGHDFVHNVWAPIRGLLVGYNPYDPTEVAYFQHYRVPVMAGLYVPAALALHAPLALLSPARCADVIALLNASLLWLAVLLLIPPRSARHCLVAGVAGTLLVASSAAQDTIFLGQLSGWALAGLALLVATLGRRPSAIWLPALGATLVALKPQSAIPTLVALGALGYWRVLGRTALILGLASVPGAVLFIRAAGSPASILRTVGDNLALVSRLPPVDLANPTNLRIDALGIVSQLHGPALTGLGWLAVAFAVTTGLLILALRAGRHRAPEALSDPYVVALVALYLVVSLYHLMYDQLLLYVGPLAAFAAIAEGRAANDRVRMVALGGAALMATGLVFRSGVRALMVDIGFPALPVHQAWVAAPTLIVLAIVLGEVNRGPSRM